jgi:phospho-N-acetylmuramoyl-pentapeptide-transferase
MFYWLIDLSNTVPGLGVFRTFLNVFRYITFRTGGAMVTGALFVFLFGPWIIDHLRLRQGKGQPIRTDGPQSHLISKKGTPTMGGLMILSGLVVSTVLWANPLNPYVWIVLAVTLGFGFVGFYDDYLKVTKQTHSGFAGRIRLLIEAVIALAACYALTRLGRVPFSTSLVIPFFKDIVLNFGWFFVIFGAFVMVGAGNAVNLTDGLDGLAIVPVMIAAASFGMIAYPRETRCFRITCRSITSPAPANWRCCAARCSARGWDSCGSTRRRRRSSWATPARWRSAACSARSRWRSSMRSCLP